MNVSIGMAALNASATIKESLESLIDIKCVKEIVIVLGVVRDYYKCNYKLVSNVEHGWSVDNTLDVIKNIKSSKIKIIIAQSILKNKSELQNIALRNVSIDTDIFFKIDADEVVKDEKDFYNAVKKFDNKEVNCLTVNFNHYWKNKNFIVKGNNWDAPVCRFYRYSTGLKYSDCKFINDGFNIMFDFFNMRYLSTGMCGCMDSGLTLEHHGYCYHKDKFIRGKIRYYKNRGIETKENVHDNYTDNKPTAGQKVWIDKSNVGVLHEVTS